MVLDIEGYIYLVASVQCGSGRTGSLPACVECYFCYMSLQGWDTSELPECAGTSCSMGSAGPAAHCSLPTSRGGLGNLCLPGSDWEEHSPPCLLLRETSTFLGVFTRCRRS